jgi:integrase
MAWPYGHIIQLLMLTAQRCGEVAAMRWSEVDFGGKTWTIPKEKAKNGIEHVVPLSDQALVVLNALPRITGDRDPLVFCSVNGKTPVTGFSTAKVRMDELVLNILRADRPDAEPVPGWTIHDLRRTATSGMARLGVAPHVADAVLNHKSGAIKGVAAVYNRYKYENEKVAALATWGQFVESLVKGKAAENLFHLAAARA